nr:MAG TPA: hypothetical protein [Bacteriophage sp.]
MLKETQYFLLPKMRMILRTRLYIIELKSLFFSWRIF